MVEADRPTMVVKVDPNTTSVVIVDRNDLVLLRTLDRFRTPEINAQRTRQPDPSLDGLL